MMRDSCFKFSLQNTHAATRQSRISYLRLRFCCCCFGLDFAIAILFANRIALSSLLLTLDAKKLSFIVTKT